MYGEGRPPLSTERERDDVRRLAKEGASIRGIAEAVFGDRRYRGRVERILRAPAPRPARKLPRREPEIDLDRLLPKDAVVPSLRELAATKREQLERAGVDVCLRELNALLKLERQLDASEELERLNAITRQAK